MIEWINAEDRIPEKQGWYLGCFTKQTQKSFVKIIKEIYFDNAEKRFSDNTANFSIFTGYWAEINLPEFL